MDQVKTATGKLYNCDYFNPFPPSRQLNLRVLGVPLTTVASVFSNKAETVQLWCDQQYASGYSNLIAIVPEGDAIRIVLGKE